MDRVDLVPCEFKNPATGLPTFPRLEAAREGTEGVPSLCSFFHTILAGARAWHRDNVEEQINVTIKVFGAPFSMMSSLFSVIIRVYQVSALLGLQVLSSAPFFVPMAVTGLIMTGCETVYQCHGIYYQLQFIREFYQRKENPQDFFAFLFHEYLGITDEERGEIIDKLLKETERRGDRDTLSAIGRATEKYVEMQDDVILAKILPLRHRIQWLATEITETLGDRENLRGVTVERATEWMELVETQAIKKLILHFLALTTILVLGAGLILAITGAPPFIPFILLSISPILTIAGYLFDCGVIDCPGWSFSWVNCIPKWVRTQCNTYLGTDLTFTPGRPLQRAEVL